MRYVAAAAAASDKEEVERSFYRPAGFTCLIALGTVGEQGCGIRRRLVVEAMR